MPQDTQTTSQELSPVILLCDDHPMIRAGISAGLNSEFGECEIIEVENVKRALFKINSENVSVAVLDLRLPDGSGLDIARHIAEQELGIPCIILTSVSDPRAVIEASDTGVVHAFIEKDADIEPILKAVRAALEGMFLLSPNQVKSALRQISNEEKLDPVSNLTAREKEIMDLIADGFSDDETGEKLFISSSTIRNALTGIYRKLGVENRTQATAAIWAGRKGETTF